MMLFGFALPPFLIYVWHCLIFLVFYFQCLIATGFFNYFLWWGDFTVLNTKVVPFLLLIWGVVFSACVVNNVLFLFCLVQVCA